MSNILSSSPYMGSTIENELLRLEFHRYFNLTINRQRTRLRSFVVIGNPASQTSTIEMIIHRDSLPQYEAWLNQWSKMTPVDQKASLENSSLQVPIAGEVYLLKGVVPVSVDIERCIILLTSTTYH